MRSRLPNIVLNVGGRRAIRTVLQLLSQAGSSPLILNVGEKHNGPVLQALNASSARVVHLDAAIGRHTDVAFDGVHLPLPEKSVDAIIVDSGLEHVRDPRAAITDFVRVLRPDGLVYVDLPFMMPVHAGPADYIRFSSAGLRALLDQFDEIERGVSCGPAMALTQMIQYTLLSLVRRQWARVTVKLICRFGLFWLKYADLFLARRPGAIDAAAGTYFIGRLSGRRLSDEELFASYRGIVPSIHEPLIGSPSRIS